MLLFQKLDFLKRAEDAVAMSLFIGQLAGRISSIAAQYLAIAFHKNGSEVYTESKINDLIELLISQVNFGYDTMCAQLDKENVGGVH